MCVFSVVSSIIVNGIYSQIDVDRIAALSCEDLSLEWSTRFEKIQKEVVEMLLYEKGKLN